MKKKIVIAGPCALENRDQYIRFLDEFCHFGIPYVRACLWKPRTEPGWEGMGFFGMPLLMEEAIKRKLTPCTEIMTAIHAQMIVDALRHFPLETGMIVWIGARNQNHFEIRRIAEILSKGPSNLKFVFKNQVWVDRKHWMGLFKHITQAGFPKERLMTCHRGFNPGYGENSRGLRNIPDFHMSMELKKEMGIPMLLDPSHIAGHREKFFQIVEESLQYDFDGYIVEVHPAVDQAKTDQGQQLDFELFTKFLDLINNKQLAAS